MWLPPFMTIFTTIFKETDIYIYDELSADLKRSDKEKSRRSIWPLPHVVRLGRRFFSGGSVEDRCGLRHRGVGPWHDGHAVIKGVCSWSKEIPRILKILTIWSDIKRYDRSLGQNTNSPLYGLPTVAMNASTIVLPEVEVLGLLGTSSRPVPHQTGHFALAFDGALICFTKQKI